MHGKQENIIRMTLETGYVTGLGIALARIERNSVERTLHLEACEVCGEPTRWSRVTCIYIHTEGNLQQFPKIPT